MLNHCEYTVNHVPEEPKGRDGTSIHVDVILTCIHLADLVHLILPTVFPNVSGIPQQDQEFKVSTAFQILSVGCARQTSLIPEGPTSQLHDLLRTSCTQHTFRCHVESMPRRIKATLYYTGGFNVSPDYVYKRFPWSRKQNKL